MGERMRNVTFPDPPNPEIAQANQPDQIAQEALSARAVPLKTYTAQQTVQASGGMPVTARLYVKSSESMDEVRPTSLSPSHRLLLERHRLRQARRRPSHIEHPGTPKDLGTMSPTWTGFPRFASTLRRRSQYLAVVVGTVLRRRGVSDSLTWCRG